MARLLTATALLSMGGLLFEVGLTRVLSLIYFSNYVFVVLSVAVLGLGVGAALASWRAPLRQKRWLSTWAALACLSALVVSAFVVVLASTPLRALALGLCLLPFGFIGLALSTIFSLRPEASHRLYWVDLLGAGLGAFAALPFLNLLGGIGGLLVSALLLGCASSVLTSNLSTAVPSLLAALLLVGNERGGWLEPNLATLDTPKPIVSQLQAGGVITGSRWDAFARSDLVFRPDQGAYYLYVDGAAGSLVPGHGAAERWQRDIGLLPFVTDEPERVFLIGPGGGLDVALAKTGGAERIVAVDLNGGGLELVDTIPAYTGELYAGVETVVDEGRSVLRRLDEPFDLIFLSQVITQTSELRGYALSEASVYTVEAFQDYLAHLADDGQIALKLYDELTLSRALFTALQAFIEQGLSEAEAARHLMAVLDTRAEPPVPLLLVRKQALDRDEAVRLARVAEGLDLALLFVPGLLANPPLAGLLTGQTRLEDLVAQARAGGLDLRPARDVRPFFFQFESGPPNALRSLLYGLGIGLSVILLALGLRRKRTRAQSTAPLLFAALGVGFMALELTVLQRTQLFLGHPTLALNMVLGTLLVGGGVGSLIGGRWPVTRAPSVLVGSGIAVVVLALLWQGLWPALTETFQAAPLATRAAVTMIGLLPLALPLGIPFPTALRLVSAHGPSEVALAWAVNGLFSVAGGLASVILALLWGYPAALGLAVGCYALIMLFGVRWGRKARIVK